MKNYIQSVQYIQSVIGDFKPAVGVVLGSGLGQFADKIDVVHTIEYKDIPNFPVSTVAGHDGKLIFGLIGEKKVVVMKGRFHYYEGYTPQTVVYPIRVMRLLGVELLLLSNAAGGVNPDFKVGDLVAISSHINFIPNPLVGHNDEAFGVRFPEMKQPYSQRILDYVKSIADVKQGVYVAVTGPSMETSAEINYFRMIGGDLVGMSTAPETIAAVHCGMEVFGMSVVTNATSQTTSHEEVVKQGNLASERMSELFKKIALEFSSVAK